MDVFHFHVCVNSKGRFRRPGSLLWRMLVCAVLLMLTNIIMPAHAWQMVPNPNSGTIDVNNFAGENILSPFTNNSGGIININNNGILTNTGTLNNSGTIDIKTGGTLTNWDTINNSASGTLTNSGGTLDNTAILNNAVNATITNKATATNNGWFTNAGTITNNTGADFTNYVDLTNNIGAIITNNGTFTNQDWSSLTNSGTLTNNNTLTNTGTITNTGTFTISSGAVFNQDSSGTYSGTGSIVLNGMINNTSFNTFDINSLVMDGGLFNSNGTGTVTIGTVTVAGGKTGTIQGTGAIGLTTADITGSLGISAPITGTGSLTKTGAGILTLSGANTYSGGTIISNGTLALSGSGTLGDSTGTTTISGGTLDLGTIELTQASLSQSGGTVQNGKMNVTTYQMTGGTLSSNATVSASSSFDMRAGTLSGILAGTGTLTKTTAGTLSLSGNNTYTGGTVINAGTVSVSSDSNLGNTSGGLTFGGGTLQTTGSFSSNRSVTLNAGGGTFDTNGNDLTLSGNMTGTGFLSKIGLGTLILSGTNNYSGGTTLTAGILQGGTTSLQGDITNNSQVIFNQNTSGTYAGIMTGTGSLTKEGTGTVILTGANTYSSGTTVTAGILQGNTTSLQGGITNNSQVTFNQNTSGTYAGIMTGTGSLTKEGTGTVILTGANTYSGGTIMNGGILQVSSDNNLGNTSGGLTFGGGTLQITSGFSSNRSVTMNAGGGTFDTNGNDLTLSGNMTGTGFLSKIGLGTLILSGTNTYSGGMTVTAGILQGNTTSLQGAITNNSQVTFIQNTNGTYAGSMTGTGSLTKDGTGTVILSGTNSYTGGTTVSAGILQGDTTSLQGTITNNSQVTFNQNTDGTCAGGMTGTGSLTKEGTGKLIFSGASNYTGATNINAGTLSVNGSITSPVTVGTAGTLMGSGTITGNTVNSGTLAPGNSIGTLTIAGNYTQNAGSTYQVEVNAAGQSDKLIVSGTATLNGGTVSVLAASGNYKKNTHYIILTAGNVVGTFADVTSNLAFLTPSLSYDPTSVYLLLNRNTSDFADVAITPNQYAVASDLDRISSSATGDMMTVMDSLLGLSDSRARGAYDQMGGLTHASLTEAASFSMNRYIGVLSGRMEGFNTGGTILADAGNIMLAYSENTGSDAGNTLLAAIQSMKANNRKEESRDISPWGLWVKGYGNMGERRGDEISTRYDYKGGGLIAGFDGKVNERLLLGVAAGYSYTKVNMNSLNDDGRVASYRGSLYSAYNIDPWYVNGLIAYGYNRYDTTRNIVFGSIARVAHANYGGHSLSGYVETGYQVKTNAVDIIPAASVQAGSLWRNAFTESDAGALDLNADSDRSSSFIGSLGVKIRKEYKTTKNGSVTPEIRVRWLHEFVNSDYTLNASFAGDPVSAFSVRGDKAHRDSASIGFGFSWEIDKSFGFALAYDAVLSGDRTEHGGTAGIKYRW